MWPFTKTPYWTVQKKLSSNQYAPEGTRIALYWAVSGKEGEYEHITSASDLARFIAFVGKENVHVCK
jgi:hypothetical protein